MKRQTSLVTSLTRDNMAGSWKEIPGCNQYRAIKPCQLCYHSTEGLHQQDKRDRKLSPGIWEGLEKAGLFRLQEHNLQQTRTARGDRTASPGPTSPELPQLGNGTKLSFGKETRRCNLYINKYIILRVTFFPHFTCSLHSPGTPCHCWWIIPF